MLIDQSKRCLERVAMQAVDEFARFFGLLQEAPVTLVFIQRHLANLLQQLIPVGGSKQNLVLPKVTQFTGGFASADPALIATVHSPASPWAIPHG